MLPDPQRFDYTPEMYTDCQEIRRCRRWAEEARRQKFVKAYGLEALADPSA